MNEAPDNCVSTGNPQMDEILHGGFPANSINIIMGQPGTGKTVFAEQMVFHHANENDRPILYVTTLSEPVAKVLTYLQRFAFFDEEKIGKSVHYQDIGVDLAEKGLSALVPFIEEAIHSLGPKLIVIDSFRALHDLSESAQAMRRMLHQLTGILTSFETTVLLVGEYTDEQSRTLPEFAIADGIVQFLRSSVSTRDERFVRVLKLRGSGYMEGLHGCRISSGGVSFYPRLVTPQLPQSYTAREELVPSGVDGLDEVIGGGFRRGSATLISGATGAGKTTLGLQFAIAGLNPSEGRSLVLNFQENPSQLALSIRNLTGKEQLPVGLELMYVSPVEMQVDSVIVTLFRRIQEERINRVVIDAIGDLALATSDAGRLHDYLYSLIQHFAVKGVTSQMAFETPGGISDAGPLSQMGRVSYMSDSIISLETKSNPRMHRELRCIKARGCDHDLEAHPFTIAADGLHVH